MLVSLSSTGCLIIFDTVDETLNVAIIASLIVASASIPSLSASSNPSTISELIFIGSIFKL